MQQQIDYARLDESALKIALDTFDEVNWFGRVGSAAVGFANSESDIDYYAVVNGSVKPVPFVNHLDGRRVEIKYISSSAVRSWCPLLERQLTTAGPQSETTEGEHLKTFYALEHSARMHTGVRLDRNTDKCSLNLMPRSELHVAAEWYWAREATRVSSSLRLLSAIVNRSERSRRRRTALLCLLELDVAARGEIYVKRKWLGDKLERTQSHVGLECLGAALRSSHLDHETYRSLQQVIVMNLPSTAREKLEQEWHLTLRVRTDVEKHDLLGARILERWKYVWQEEPTNSIMPGDIVWRQNQQSDPSDWSLEAYRAGILYLGAGL